MEHPRSHALIILATVAAIYSMVFMERTAPGLVTPDLLAQFHVSPTTLSLMTMGQYSVYAILQVPVAVGGNRFRAEKMLVVGAFLDGLGTLLFAVSHTFAMVVLSRVIVGMGDALIWLNIVVVLMRWFSYSVFGRVLGITAMSGNIGALIATIPLAVWIDAAGWRMPFGVMGSALMGLALLSGLIFSRLNPVHPEIGVKRDKAPWSRVLSAGWRIGSVSLTHFGMMGPFLGFVSLFAVPYLRHSYHVSEVAAGAFLAFGLVGSLFGGPIAGILADRFGVTRPYRLISVMNLAAWTLLVLWPSQLRPPLLALVFAVLGMANGASVLTFAAIRERFSHETVGLASGIANTAGFTSAVVVPLLMGVALSCGYKSRMELAVGLPFASLGLLGTIFLGRFRPTNRDAHPQKP